MIDSLYSDETISLFVEDSKDYINQIYDGILRLEVEKEKAEILNTIFRALHSIKGAAGIYRFMNLIEVTHCLESVFDKARSNELEISEKIIELLLEGNRITEAIVENVYKHKRELTIDEINETLEVDLNEFIKEVNNVNTIKEQVELEIVKNEEFYKISFDISEQEKFKITRLVIIYKDIGDIFEIKETFPNNQKLLNGNISQDGCKKGQVIIKSIENIDLIKKELDYLDLLNLKIEILKEKSEKKQNVKKENKEIIQMKEYIRIEKNKLDNLFNVVGEIFIEKSIMNQLYAKLEEIYSSFVESENPKKELNKLSNYLKEMYSFNKIQDREMTELQEITTSLRMVPVKSCFKKFPFIIRDLSNQLGKQIELITKGEDTEIDKLISEKISDPLIHMIRNSIDHGIEFPDERVKKRKNAKGKIQISSYNSGNSVIIEIKDDGKGMDVNKIIDLALKKNIITEEEIELLNEKEKLNLIFHPGFSTSESITDISGRGVGMDVVKKNIEELNGRIDVHTEIDKGTTFKIILPLTLAIIRAVIVEVNDNILAFSSDSVVTIDRIRNDDIDFVNEKEVVKFRNSVIPLLNFNKMFHNEFNERKKNEFENMLVIKNRNGFAGFKVDKFINQQYIVVKNIEGDFVRNKSIIGAAVLGNGMLSMVLDTNYLAEVC